MDASFDPLEEAISAVGLAPLARELGITYQAIRRWQRAGRMPRTEWTGETCYAQKIERVTGGKVSAEALMQWRRVERPTEMSGTFGVSP